jgi:DNA invertase Pin-like site-specific DNA recombinase
MINNSIRNVVIYTRVSTDEQAEHGFSLPHQKEALEKYCESHSIRILKHYQEDASGKDFNRPAFIQLFEYAKVNKKEVDAIIFTRWDRFSRNLEESLKYKRLFNVMGITLMSIDQVLDNTVPESKMMFAVLNVVAEIERDKISIRTREGVRRANKEGYFTNNQDQ